MILLSTYLSKLTEHTRLAIQPVATGTVTPYVAAHGYGPLNKRTICFEFVTPRR